MVEIRHQTIQVGFYRSGNCSHLIVNQHIVVKDFYQTFLLEGTKVLIKFPILRTDHKVHHGSVWFDKVVHKVEGVSFGSVEDPKHGQESLRCDGPSQGSPDNGISVVEEGIDLTLAPARKVFSKHGRKIDPCCHTLDVVRITGFDISGHISKSVSSVPFKEIETFCLILDLLPYDFRPESFSLDFRHPELAVSDPRLAEVTGIGD